jgi:hypothetical protein
MFAAERLTLERELRDLGMSSAERALIATAGGRAFEILPPDQRRYWSGMLAVPYRWICSIEVYRSNPKWGGHGQARWLLHGKGTGVLICADCLLTAAHNLWREEGGEPRRVDRVVVVPARDGKNRPFGSVEAADWRTPAAWNPGRPQRRWDFAVIRLNEAIGSKPFKALGDRQLGWWGSASLGEGTSMKPLRADWLIDRRVISTG